MIEVLKFGAEWCSQCKAMDKELKEHPLIIEPKIINVDDEEDLVDKYNIKNIPTILVINNEEVIKTWIGRTSSKEINDFLKSVKEEK